MSKKFTKLAAIASGKTKTLYETSDNAWLVMEFRDDVTGFDGAKSAKLARKGAVNNAFNAFIMKRLAAQGVPTHFLRTLSSSESLVQRLEMLPIECVVRNIATGSLCRRLGVEDGLALTPPTYELFLKDDERGDPMINESHALAFRWANENQLAEAKRLTLAANEVLRPLFLRAGMLLVDYKLEFGVNGKGQLVMGDEFTPDGCRLWDRETREKLDKDRFRQDLGDVVESYEIAARRLGVEL